MLRPAVYILVSMMVLCSCKVIDPVGSDIVFGPAGSTTRLQLLPDSTFELAFLDPPRDSLLVAGLPFKAFSVKGTWAPVGKDRWKLVSGQTGTTTAGIDDSISRFTTINSFVFWDKYGAPVRIRSIRFGRSRPKPHYGNSLYFFAQDFYEADTVRFEIDGYPEFSYPGSIPWAIGNNAHKITLIAPEHNYLPGPIMLQRKRTRLYIGGSGKPLTKK